MKCPNCGYQRQKRDDAYVPATECPSCGIVYSKHAGAAAPAIPISNAAAPSSLPPSPVDPESLKKAKDRVEKRLRERLESTVKDERHTRTLELARKLTKSAVRERQREKTAARDKIDENSPTQNDNDGSEGIVAPEEEALLLEDAVGVQIHDGQNAMTPETPAEEARTHLTASDEIRIEASDDSDFEIQNPISNEETDINQTAEDTEDVQVETVRLDATELSIGQTPDNSCETNASDSVDDAAVGEETQLPPAHIASNSTTAGAQNFGRALRRMLPVIAWLILFSGIIGAVLSWTTISDVEAGVKIPVPNGSGSPSLGLLLGFAYLATGALGFAFFWVSSLISRQLKDIQRLLMVHPIAMASEQTNGNHPQPHGLQQGDV